MYIAGAESVLFTFEEHSAHMHARLAQAVETQQTEVVTAAEL